MAFDTFWQEVDDYLVQASMMTTARDLIALTNTYWGPVSGDAFFPGSGGDNQLIDVLIESKHWTFEDIEADYYWTARGADGQILEYIEGDLYAR